MLPVQVTASTSVLMILFSSSAISLSFYFQGLLNTSYAAVLAPLCFVASLIGARPRSKYTEDLLQAAAVADCAVGEFCCRAQQDTERSVV